MPPKRKASTSSPAEEKPSPSSSSSSKTRASPAAKTKASPAAKAPAKKTPVAKKGSKKLIDLTTNSDEAPSPPPSKKAKKEKAKPVTSEHDTLTVDKLYELLCDAEDPEQIAMDGICKLCEILCIDPQDVRSLMLLWRLGVQKNPGSITKEEFVQGMKVKLAKKTVKDLRAYLPFCDPGFLTSDEYRDFYKFAHFFSREASQKRALEKDVVVSLLPVVLDNTRAPHLTGFLQYLQSEDSKEFTHISPDAWDSFYVFNRNVSVSLVDYDEDGSWPTIIDSYVEWIRAKRG